MNNNLPLNNMLMNQPRRNGFDGASGHRTIGGSPLKNLKFNFFKLLRYSQKLALTFQTTI
jgi:hypothetical protein